MIGVIAASSEHRVVSEFFELFKTPWEFYRSDRRYEVLLCAEECNLDDYSADLILIYAGRRLMFDVAEQIGTVSQNGQRMLSYNGSRIPIYGHCITFPARGAGLLIEEDSQQPAMHQHQSRGDIARLGYDLFHEVDILLTVGQPAIHAGIPTLDIHIALLRDLIVASGITLVEIPPVPDGYRFIACLTHDVDHPSILRHKWDHTMFGFLYRAAFGSINNFFHRRITIRDLIANWVAVFKLPFVYKGLAKDFWGGFEDRYLEVEKGISSTYFVIPFKNRPGKNFKGNAPKFRASRYEAGEIADTIRKIMAAGCEIGLHGIDAWTDTIEGRKELQEIRRLTGVSEIGVRMHWLYYDHHSAAVLEKAEASYDSTIGYRETVGYHAGTTQVYRPLQSDRLLELPMHVMDTALFFPAYLGLTQRQASTILSRLADNAVHFGGCMTINWHDRSLAPERLWFNCYRDLVENLKDRGAWFATAGQATSWFQKRRSVVFGSDDAYPNVRRAKLTHDDGKFLPGLRLRIYNAQLPETDAQCPSDYVDIIFDESIDRRDLYGTGR